MTLTPFRCIHCCISFQGTLDLAGSSVCMNCRRDAEQKMSFRVGDVVKCVNDSEVELTEGRLYTVTGNQRWSDDMVWVVADNGRPQKYYPARFAPAPQPATTTPTFKAGDVVECVKAFNMGAVLGNRYTVAKDFEEGDKWLKIEMDSAGNANGGYEPSRFKLVTSATPAPQPGATTATTFKFGDVVECVDASGLTDSTRLAVGQGYKVGRQEDGLISVKDNSRFYTFYAIERFKPATSTTLPLGASDWSNEDIGPHRVETGAETSPGVAVGVKHDSGKPQFRLVNPDFLLQMVNVLTLGARKYPSADNFKQVEPFRYEDALERHWNAWRRGEKDDPESKMSHLAHVAVNAMFLFYFDAQKAVKATAEAISVKLF